jgi:hypothetical protein
MASMFRDPLGDPAAMRFALETMRRRTDYFDFRQGPGKRFGPAAAA